MSYEIDKEQVQKSNSSEAEKVEVIKILDNFDKDLNEYYGEIEQSKQNENKTAAEREAARSLAEAKRLAQEQKERENLENLTGDGVGSLQSRRRSRAGGPGRDAYAVALQYFAGSEKVSDRDMRDAIIDVIANRRSRHEAAKEFVDSYHPKYIEAKREAELRVEGEQLRKAEREAEEAWIRKEAEGQAEFESNSEYVKQLIKQYADENQGTKRQDKKDVIPERVS